MNDFLALCLQKDPDLRPDAFTLLQVWSRVDAPSLTRRLRQHSFIKSAGDCQSAFAERIAIYNMVIKPYGASNRCHTLARAHVVCQAPLRKR